MPRTRSIPHEQTLEQALHVFWAKGYDRASIADLCQATGLGPSSIYNAFGSKLEFFKQALNHYLTTYASLATDELDPARPANESIRGFLRCVVTLCTSEGSPPGCFLMQGGGAGISENSEACSVTNQIKASLRGAIRDMLSARQIAGDHLAEDPHTLSLLVMASMRGLSQLACDGSSAEDLYRVADLAAASCVRQHDTISPSADRPL